jgi:hypothetical protein
MRQSVYYVTSGRPSEQGVAIGVLAAVAAGLVLAVAYVYLVLYVPLAGYLSAPISAGFGALVGFTTGKALRWAQVRHRVLAIAASVSVALVVWYAVWVIWVWALLRRDGTALVLSSFAFSPTIVWGLVQTINQAGAWTIFGLTPTGFLLWILWLGESVLILVPAAMLPLRLVADPFCEHCNSWCALDQGVARLRASPGPDLKRRMEAKDLEYLERLGRVKPGASEWLRLDLHSCPHCDVTNTLTVKAVTVSVDEKGRRSENAATVVKHVLLDIVETDRVRALGR